MNSIAMCLSQKSADTYAIKHAIKHASKSSELILKRSTSLEFQIMFNAIQREGKMTQANVQLFNDQKTLPKFFFKFRNF